MKFYFGRRTEGMGNVVRVSREDNHIENLNPRPDLGAFAESTFDWGAPGPNSSQLAIALLADHFGDDKKAIFYYVQFYDRLISKIKSDHWTMNTLDINKVISNIDNNTQGRGA